MALPTFITEGLRAQNIDPHNLVTVNTQLTELASALYRGSFTEALALLGAIETRLPSIRAEIEAVQS